LAFFGPLVVVALAAGLHVALGGSMPPSPAWGQIPLAVINLFGVLLLGGPLGEEFGWRGYALPHLQVRMGWRLASWLGIHAAAWQQPWRCTPRSITGPPSCP
jgi:membrane protease YdiL (CAAX protease family)